MVHNYSLARNIAVFVSYALNGQDLPSLFDTYPGMFDEYTPKVSKGPAPWEFYKEQMLDFADKHNKKRGEKKLNDN